MNVPHHGTAAVGLSALGTERLGIGVIRHPAVAAVVLLAMTLAAVAAGIAWLRFDGDITRVLASRAAPYAAFTRLERRFHPFSHDEVLLVRAPELATAVVLAAALMVTGLSAMAVVLSFGCVVITVLVFALAADILVLPSMAVELERRTNRGPLP